MANKIENSRAQTATVQPSQLKLFCWVLDISHRPFAVNIARDETVSDLADAIKLKKPNSLGNVDADSLIIWKVSIPESSINKDLRHLHFEDEGSSRATAKLSHVFVDPPKNDHVHIVVRAPPSAIVSRSTSIESNFTDDQPQAKRARLEQTASQPQADISPVSMPVDRTDDICAELVQPFDFTPKLASEIVPLIRSDLLGKLPVLKEFFIMMTQQHPPLVKNLQPAYGEMAFTLTHALREVIGTSASAGGSEDMLHSPVDALLRYPLMIIRSSLGKQLPIEIDRNRTDDGTSIKAHSRPDFLLWVRDRLMFWGEEKAQSGAKEDLETKFRQIEPLFFGDIKFMICYAVNGCKMRFYAVEESSKQPDPFVPLTEELDITHLIDRFEVLRVIINLARIIVTIRDILPIVTYPLGKALQFGDTMITFGPKSVEKQIPLAHLPHSLSDAASRIDFLRQMYSYASGRRGLPEIAEAPRLSKNRTNYKVTLKTRGIPSQKPRTEDEVRAMTKDVVSALAWLHSGGYLHGDVRISNIVYDPAVKQWILIDFEHGGREGDTSNSVRGPLKDWDDLTCDDGIYTTASEMYQLGKLLAVMAFSEDGNDFVARLWRKEMTARESLEHKWICNLQ